MQTTGVTNTKIGVEASGFYSSYDTVNSRKHYYLKCYTDNSVVHLARFNQTINLTGYNYLKFEAYALEFPDSDSSYVGVGVSTSSTVTATSSLAAYTTISDVGGIGIVNISSLSGNYYIYLICRHNASSDDYSSITNIFLSKT